MTATNREDLEARVDALQVAVDRLEAAVVDLADALDKRVGTDEDLRMANRAVAALEARRRPSIGEEPTSRGRR